MAGALSGVRVLEFSQIVAAPYCGLQLADLGADVVKVESPAGDSVRRLGAALPGEGKFFHWLNRGKRGMVLDLQVEAAQELVHRIVPQFDVVIINSRPGVPARLHIDYETLREFRANLVYLENSGFGPRGPAKMLSGSDIVAQAYSGLMASDGKLDESGAPELITSAPVSDLASGLAGAMGICAALLHRSVSGKGQYLHTSLLASALSLQGHTVSRVPLSDAFVRNPLVARVAELREAHASYEDIMNARRQMTRPGGSGLYYGSYRVKDGAVTLGSLTPTNAEQMRHVLGIDDDPTAAPEFDALDPRSAEVTRTMRARIERIMLTKTVAEWLAAFQQEGAPVSGVQLPEELADDPQVEALGIMLELDHELTGPERIVGPIVEMSETPTGARRASPPLGRHTEEVLLECGLTAAEIEALREAHAIP